MRKFVYIYILLILISCTRDTTAFIEENTEQGLALKKWNEDYSFDPNDIGYTFNVSGILNRIDRSISNIFVMDYDLFTYDTLNRISKKKIIKLVGSEALFTNDNNYSYLNTTDTLTSAYFTINDVADNFIITTEIDRFIGVLESTPSTVITVTKNDEGQIISWKKEGLSNTIFEELTYNEEGNIIQIKQYEDDILIENILIEYDLNINPAYISYNKFPLYLIYSSSYESFSFEKLLNLVSKNNYVTKTLINTSTIHTREFEYNNNNLPSACILKKNDSIEGEISIEYH